MGYYTYFTMSVENASSDDVEKIVRLMKDMDIIPYALDEDFTGSQCAKWYQEPEDMVRVSLAFPHVHFVVYGEGEEQGDIWEHHYLNGMIQELHAEIVMPQFNPNGWRESEYAQSARIKNQELPAFIPMDASSLLNG